MSVGILCSGVLWSVINLEMLSRHPSRDNLQRWSNMVLEHSLNCTLVQSLALTNTLWRSAVVHLVPGGILGNMCA